MNRKKTASIVASAFISMCFLVGCGEAVNVKSGGIMLDKDVKPTVTATYEENSKQVLNDYFAVAANHIVDGDIDYDNEEVQAAARPAAAKLFAYACYNERQIDKYVYFSNQSGDTVTDSADSASAVRQEYFLRVNESDKTCGYRYHYTIKKVIGEPTGTLSMFKSVFESARTRITDKTDLLYRLEGTNIRVGEKNETLDGIEMLECDWARGKDWGEHDLKIIKDDYIAPEAIADHIVEAARLTQEAEDNNINGVNYISIHGNINILAENMVKSAIIFKEETEENGFEGYGVLIVVDTDVANNDTASLQMLRLANSSSDCVWVSDDDVSGLTIFCRLWPNGLFRTYTIAERWSGKIKIFKGTADSSTSYYYSYSDRDCDMTRYLKIIEETTEG